MIVNAPMTFTTVWSMIKAWLDEKTREKIQIKVSKYKETLLKYVDAEQLPEFLGGKSTLPLEADSGPWTDFETVDSMNPTDQVGVKRISTGQFHSLDEFLTFPNYMIGDDAPVIEAANDFGEGDGEG